MNSDTNITGTVDNLVHLTGLFNVEIQTINGGASFDIENQFTPTFTAISLTEGSTAGNIITLTVTGVSTHEVIGLSSGATSILDSVITQSFNEVVV